MIDKKNLGHFVSFASVITENTVNSEHESQKIQKHRVSPKSQMFASNANNS